MATYLLSSLMGDICIFRELGKMSVFCKALQFVVFPGRGTYIRCGKISKTINCRNLLPLLPPLGPKGKGEEITLLEPGENWNHGYSYWGTQYFFPKIESYCWKYTCISLSLPYLSWKQAFDGVCKGQPSSTYQFSRMHGVVLGKGPRCVCASSLSSGERLSLWGLTSVLPYYWNGWGIMWRCLILFYLLI